MAHCRPYPALLLPLMAALIGACGGAPASSSSATGAADGSRASAPDALTAQPASTLTVAAAAIPAAREPLTFAIPQWSLNYVAPMMAAHLGYFDEAGIDLKIDAIQSNLTVAAMQRGDLQISGSGGSAIRAAVQGAPFKLVSFMTVRPTFYLLVTPDVRAPAQLVGKRIGVNNLGGSQQFMTEVYAREQGIEPSQIPFAALGPNPTTILAALQAGALDGAVFDPGSTAVAEAQGLHLLKWLGETVPEPTQGMIVTEEFAQRSPDTIRRFLTALVRGLLYTKQHPRGVAEFARGALGHDMDEAAGQRGVRLLADAISAEAPGYADADGLAAFYLYDVRIPLEIPADQPIPALHDFRYLLDAYDALGIPRPR